MPRRTAYLLAWLAFTAVSAPAASAAETLSYVAELRSAATLWNWAAVGSATISTRDTDQCPDGGQCRETTLWMTSEGKSLLESIYPLRYLYRTTFRPSERSTLAFEELRKRRKVDDPAEYQWRHRVIWLAGAAGDSAATRYDLDEQGDAMPDALGAWITTGKAGGIVLKVKNTRRIPMPLPALDRWGTFQVLRTMTLEKGASWTLRGAGPKGPLVFDVVVEKKEKVEAAGRSRETWKLRIDERRSEVTGTDPAPLFVWIATDDARTPVRFDMDHDVGRLRLTLQ